MKDKKPTCVNCGAPIENMEEAIMSGSNLFCSMDCYKLWANKDVRWTRSK